MQCLGCFLTLVSATPRSCIQYSRQVALASLKMFFILVPQNFCQSWVFAPCRLLLQISCTAPSVLLLPRSSAAQAAAFHELLKFHFLFVTKQTHLLVS